jgi:hypothetical protein
MKAIKNHKLFRKNKYKFKKIFKFIKTRCGKNGMVENGDLKIKMRSRRGKCPIESINWEVSQYEEVKTR